MYPQRFVVKHVSHICVLGTKTPALPRHCSEGHKKIAWSGVGEKLR